MLYFVATPIGNLGDISYRALETLKNVDLIACEDTRKTTILLNHYDIHKRLISYHKNNEFNSAKGIVELLKSGKNVAVVSDAGMPIISDPGQVLISLLKENNLEYTIIPGANAGLCALVLSGFDALRFSFLGFLPEKNADKVKLLENFKNSISTLIIYVAPHDVEKTLNACFEIFGPRRACLVKEITKVFETSYTFELGQATEIELKGEFVLVIDGAKEVENELQGLTIVEQIEYFIEQGKTKKEALKLVAKTNKIKNIYKYLEENNLKN